MCNIADSFDLGNRASKCSLGMLLMHFYDSRVGDRLSANPGPLINLHLYHQAITP